MMMREIRITGPDMERLRALIEEARRGDPRKRAEFKDLEAELDRAMQVPAQEMPRDVITMNSEALLVDLDTGEEMIYRLVFPGQADIARMQISILAPVGTAMLGYRVGDAFEWEVPAGRRRLMVKEILYQPEGDGSPRE
jgi:regulator of nucleoside diphosphate kinase